MKDLKESFATLLIIFICLKLIDFNHMNALDYMLCILLIVYIIILIINRIMKGASNGTGKEN